MPLRNGEPERQRRLQGDDEDDVIKVVAHGGAEVELRETGLGQNRPVVRETHEVDHVREGTRDARPVREADVEGQDDGDDEKEYEDREGRRDENPAEEVLATIGGATTTLLAFGRLGQRR